MVTVSVSMPADPKTFCT